MDRHSVMEHILYDLEWKGGFNTPTDIHCAVLMDVDTEEVVSFHDHPDFYHCHGTYGGGIGEAINLLRNSKRMAGHNIVEADIHVLRQLSLKYTGKEWEYDGEVVDTILLSRLLNADRPRPYGLVGRIGPHSIEAWGLRLGNVPAKVGIEQWDVFTPEMLDRCIKDVLINLGVYKRLYEEATN